MAGFNNEDLVSRPELFHQAADRCTLPLEAARPWHMQLQMGNTDEYLTVHPLIPVPWWAAGGL